MHNNKRLEPTIKHGRFYNNNHEGNKRFLWDYIYMAYSFLHEVYIFLKSLAQGSKRLPADYSSWVDKSPVEAQSIDPVITWIGHATFLIQIGNVNILTDPIFGNSTIFFPRILSPGISLENLPKIDFVIISHNHPDHMDKNSLLALKELNPDITILVPQGDKKWFLKRNFKNVFENLWWQELSFGLIKEQIKFTFLPAYHWSQRGLFDQNKSLWGSWMIEHNNNSIYFAGDTGYSDHFKEIAAQFNKIDIALMPVGPCEPREKMCHSHTSSEESAQAFLELNATHFIPMHWGTFHFGTDTFELPITRLRDWWKINTLKLESKSLHIVKFGKSTVFENLQNIQPVIQKSPQVSL
ncbi:MAG: MBL fold metallo-hydrolase [Candidatus Babeliales bacterium]|nr:MBL fold metallo-hydrolase [Candidatus Babeliales bacterium]